MDIILFALLAAFIAYRVYTVLGKRTGHEPRNDPFAPPTAQNSGNVVHLPDRTGAAGGEDDEPLHVTGDDRVDAALTAIRNEDPTFDPEDFVQGARTAFEMIVTSFAAGDTDTLRPLLNDQVYNDFSAAIREREEANETLETTFIGFQKVEIVSAEMQGKMAFVSIKFVSDQINVTRNASGEAIEGDQSVVEEITDIWTFARNTRSKDPNWKLVATQSPQ